MTTADIIGLSVLGAAVVGGGVFLIVSRQPAANAAAGAQARPLGPQQVQGTTGKEGGFNLGGAIQQGAALVGEGVQLWNNLSSLWS